MLLAENAAGADPQCEGHNLLSAPRPEASCQTIVAKIHPSPDKKLHATVLAAEISLDATPDMESRVVIRSVNQCFLLVVRDSNIRKRARLKGMRMLESDH
jgi:hypothetical protein